MSATNQTAVYGLPIFLGTDVPSWLTDWNGAMGDIDTAIAAAKAAADAAASTASTAATDIVTINGQITSLQNTVGTHTTQIGTISGNINTINSLIGNGTPTTTDQTIIGAINELHANQGNLANLTTTDKTSLVAAINEAAQGGGGGTETVRYYNGYIQYSTDNGVTWINLINVSTPVQLLPLMTSDSSSVGVASKTGTVSGDAYKAIDGSVNAAANACTFLNSNDSVVFTFTDATYVKYVNATYNTGAGADSTMSIDHSADGVTWITGATQTVTGDSQDHTVTESVNAVVKAIRIRKVEPTGSFYGYKMEAYN